MLKLDEAFREIECCLVHYTDEDMEEVYTVLDKNKVEILSTKNEYLLPVFILGYNYGVNK